MVTLDFHLLMTKFNAFISVPQYITGVTSVKICLILIKPSR